MDNCVVLEQPVPEGLQAEAADRHDNVAKIGTLIPIEDPLLETTVQPFASPLRCYSPGRRHQCLSTVQQLTTEETHLTTSQTRRVFIWASDKSHDFRVRACMRSRVYLCVCVCVRVSVCAVSYTHLTLPTSDLV